MNKNQRKMGGFWQKKYISTIAETFFNLIRLKNEVKSLIFRIFQKFEFRSISVC